MPPAQGPKVENPDTVPALHTATPYVDDKYEAGDMIGQGTYGNVFRARVKGSVGSRLEDQVALKRIRMESEKEGFPITALREIKLLKQLKHENIVTLREIVRSKVNQASKYKGDIYMVFDYAKYDLSAILKKVENREMHLSEAQVKCIMRQLLRGLAYCHVNGVLHRDLKSANLLINERGELKIADFGLARPYQSNADDGRLTSRVCTLWYRPPELLLGSEQYDGSVDVWSVGCILAELLSRKPLFPGKDESDMVNRIFSMFGVPKEADWPGVSGLPFYGNINQNIAQGKTLKRWCEEHKVPNHAFPLLQGLLTLNPKKRITAADAFNHDYFRQEPRECPISQLIPPHISDSHEYTAKQKKRQHDDRGHAQGPAQQQQRPSHPQQHHHHHPQQQQQHGGYGAHGYQQQQQQHRGGPPPQGQHHGPRGSYGGGGGYGAPPPAAAAAAGGPPGGHPPSGPPRGGRGYQGPGGGGGYQGGGAPGYQGGYQGGQGPGSAWAQQGPQQGYGQQGPRSGQQWGGPPRPRPPAPGFHAR